ncbi:MAG: hypothetical protein WDW36_005735 [Sanguina aurantia]
MSQPASPVHGAGNRAGPFFGTDSSKSASVSIGEACFPEPARRAMTSTYRNLTVGLADHSDSHASHPPSGEDSLARRTQDEDDHASALLLEEWDRSRVEEGKHQDVQPMHGAGPDSPVAGSSPWVRQGSAGGGEPRAKPPKQPSGERHGRWVHGLSPEQSAAARLCLPRSASAGCSAGGVRVKTPPPQQMEGDGRDRKSSGSAVRLDAAGSNWWMDMSRFSPSRVSPSKVQVRRSKARRNSYSSYTTAAAAVAVAGRSSSAYHTTERTQSDAHALDLDINPGPFSSVTSARHPRNSHQHLSSLSFQGDHPPGLAHHRATYSVRSHRPASAHSYSQSQNAQPRRSPLSSCDFTGAAAAAAVPPVLASGRGSSSVRLHGGSSTGSMDGGSSPHNAGSGGGHSGSLGGATASLKKTLGKLVPQALSMVSSAMGRPGPSGLRVASVVRSETSSMEPRPSSASHGGHHPHNLLDDELDDDLDEDGIDPMIGTAAHIAHQRSLSPGLVAAVLLAQGSGPPQLGPTTHELQLMGAATSVSFKKSVSRHGIMRPLTTLPPFMPRLLKENIIREGARYKAFDTAVARDLAAASSTLQPIITDFKGAVMIGDVKGFTALTEILSKKGTAGVELLTTCMNNYFTRVISMILSHNGDVIKFAGDSMIVAFWPSEEEAREPDEGHQAATQRMCRCAHELATRLGHMRMKMNGQVEPFNLQLAQAHPQAPPPDGRATDHAESKDLSRHSITASAQAAAAAAARLRRPPTLPSDPRVNTASAAASQHPHAHAHANTPLANAGSAALQPGSNASSPASLNAAGGCHSGCHTTRRGRGEAPTGLLACDPPAAIGQPPFRQAPQQLDPACPDEPGSEQCGQEPARRPAAGAPTRQLPWWGGPLPPQDPSAGGAAPPTSRQSADMSGWLGWGWGSTEASAQSAAAGLPASAAATAAGSGDGRWHGGGFGGASTSGAPPEADSSGGARERSLWSVMGGGGGGGSHPHTGGGTAHGGSGNGERSATLWGNDEGLGVTKREVSLMSQLAMPPPLRAMNTHRASAVNAAASLQGGRPPAAPLLPADLNALLLSSQTSSFHNSPGGYDAEAGTHGQGAQGSGAHPAFNSAFRASLSGASRLGGGSIHSSAAVTPTAAAAAAAAAAVAGQGRMAAGALDDRSWQAKLLDLSSGVTLSSNQQHSRGPGSPGGGSNSSIGGLEEELVPRTASRMNQPARGSWVMVDPVGHAEGSEAVDGPPAVPASPPWMDTLSRAAEPGRSHRNSGAHAESGFGSVVPEQPCHDCSGMESTERGGGLGVQSGEARGQTQTRKPVGPGTKTSRAAGASGSPPLREHVSRSKKVVKGQRMPTRAVQAQAAHAEPALHIHAPPLMLCLHCLHPSIQEQGRRLAGSQQSATPVSGPSCTLFDLEYSTDGYDMPDLAAAKTGPGPGPGPVTEGLDSPSSSPGSATLPSPAAADTPPRLAAAHSARPSPFAAGNSARGTSPRRGGGPAGGGGAGIAHLSYSQPRARGGSTASKLGDVSITLQASQASQASQSSVGSRATRGPHSQLQQQPSMRSVTSNSNAHNAASSGLVSMVASWFGSALAGGGSGGGRQGRGNGRLGSESFSNYGHDEASLEVSGHPSASGASGTGPPHQPHLAGGSGLYAHACGGNSASLRLSSLYGAPPNANANASGTHTPSSSLYGTGAVHGPGRAARGDPIMEEVQNTSFSIKIMVSAGVVCVFHVGGSIDDSSDPNQPKERIPRWEFFIGDRPLAPLIDSEGRRGCINQLAEIEKHADAADVVASHEVLALIGADWEYKVGVEGVMCHQ